MIQFIKKAMDIFVLSLVKHILKSQNFEQMK